MPGGGGGGAWPSRFSRIHFPRFTFFWGHFWYWFGGLLLALYLKAFAGITPYSALVIATAAFTGGFVGMLFHAFATKALLTPLREGTAPRIKTRKWTNPRTGEFNLNAVGAWIHRRPTRAQPWWLSLGFHAGSAVVRSQENYVVQWSNTADPAPSRGDAKPAIPLETARALEGLPVTPLASRDPRRGRDLPGSVFGGGAWSQGG